MARTAIFSDDGEMDGSNLDTTHISETSTRRLNDDPSPSSIQSFGSDKENRPSSTTQKGKQRSMQAIGTPTSEVSSARSSRKRKLGERDTQGSGTQAIHHQRLKDAGNESFYDPNQSIHDRRAIRKDYRDLSKELTESRAEFLAPGSSGLVDTLDRSNRLFASVKQTSDATLDSRLLVSTADLSMKRTTQLNLGDSTTGIDVEDFVSKCITFMRRGPPAGDASTQAPTQRRRRMANHSDDEEGQGDYDEGDSFNWEYLGRHACCPYNVRPAVPGFLLGPLSVQKRVRKATQRRERQQALDPKDAVRPEQLREEDLEATEKNNLTQICKNVRDLLERERKAAEARVEKAYSDAMSDDDIKDLMWENGIANDGGIPLFRFVVNPNSFSQTVENLFYTSFLIKEGGAGIGSDSDGLPTLTETESRSKSEQQEQNVQKHQAIFHLDYETWEDIIETFGIRKSIIPHRQPDPAAINATGRFE